jgi:hypothetical protein
MFIKKVADKNVFDENALVEKNWMAYSLKVLITVESLIAKGANKT